VREKPYSVLDMSKKEGHGDELVKGRQGGGDVRREGKRACLSLKNRGKTHHHREGVSQEGVKDGHPRRGREGQQTKSTCK